MKIYISTIIFLLFFNVSFSFGKKISKEDVLVVMKKASDYMVNAVSCNGGYVWKYSEDLSERYGEAPARESQIWVQGGTPEMGHHFLDMYEATNGDAYLEYAKKAANALIYGQHPLGGWHYFIDFDKRGLDEWYKNVASRFLTGMEEYRYYYGNCTFDDNATQGATAYLMRTYQLTGLPEYLGALNKALDFILISQYPNGGWPQRFPLRYDFAHDGLPDYTSYYTLNDNAISNTIDVLINAYELLGNERYLEAARRGGDFFMIAQGPNGQAGWAEQYDMNLQAVQARTHEPGGFMPRQTVNTINTLEKLFLYTGDHRYLRAIPAAIDWLENSKLEVLDNGNYKYARYYSPESNIPVYIKFTEISETGYQLYKTTTNEDESYAGWSWSHTVDMKSVVDRYDRIKNIDEEDREKLYDELFRDKDRKSEKPEDKEVLKIINTMNDNGAWVGDIKVWDYSPDKMTIDRKVIRGIDIDLFMENTKKLMSYIQ